MYFHRQELQFKAKPSQPDPIFARRLQEVLGGQYGEITVALQYGFQAWNSHLPGKYRDLLFGIGAEELGHVEMLAVMIAQLLEKTPVQGAEDTADADPALGAVIGGMDVQHAIVAGAGARAVDSNGNPWQGSYITASGNLLADFTANANAEMQGRLQVARLYHMTDDHGVRDLLSFLLARDTMHQNQWIRAAMELREEGHEDLPVPSNFPLSKEERSVSYEYINFSDGAAAAEGSWASGPTPDGKGQFSYREGPGTSAPMPPATQPDGRLYGTTAKPNLVEKTMGIVKDAVEKK
ncbi:manganese catalase family protein [Naasia sp. SYSU D00948]|uniref:manganese catalase family protein n=1 Tax=Naasia sp. SYSU D00948 TaxID=2817379 RepID=UPI001B30C28E|nr:manganese catalase family protein [Naasia sp. SYSU D00948]